MDPKKVKAIQEQQTPIIVKGVRSFLGFTNFYQCFIKHYLDMVQPLTKLTHKDKAFKWNNKVEEAFQRLKRIFLLELALAQFNYKKETRVKTDLSSQCIGGTLLQPNANRLYILCVFFSQKLLSTKCNYKIYNKEILVIIHSLEEQDTELQSLKEFKVYLDYKNLEHFIIVQKLTE